MPVHPSHVMPAPNRRWSAAWPPVLLSPENGAAPKHMVPSLDIWLRQEAKAACCVTVSGLEMFVGQAAEQFRLFTGLQPPVDLMRQVVLDSLS